MGYDFQSLTKQLDEAENREQFYTDFEDVDPNTLHQISELTQWIRTKGKGSDVREVIAQLFERTLLEGAREGNANIEVAQARGKFGNLDSRLAAVENLLSQAKKDSPKGVFDDYAALVERYPTGEPGVFITKDNAHWWAWDGSRWFDGGKYQGAVIEREEIKLEHLSEEVRSLFPKMGVPIPIEKINRLSNVELHSENGIIYKSDGQNYDLWNDVIKFGSNHVIFKAERNDHWLLLDDTPEGRRILNISNANNKYTKMNTQLTRLLPSKKIEVLEGGGTEIVINRTFNHFTKGDYIEVINKNNKIIINKKSPTDNDFVPLALIPHTATSLGLVAGVSGSEVYGLSKKNILVSELQSFEIDDIFSYFANLENEVKNEISSKKKYAVVLVAGQSNAVGYDESVANALFEDAPHNRIFELGIYGNDNLKVKQLEYSAQNFQNMTNLSHPNSNPKIGTKGIHLPLGKLLAKELPDDYNILFVSCAHGGTGFTTNASFGTYNANAMLPSDGALKWVLIVPITKRWWIELNTL